MHTQLFKQPRLTLRFMTEELDISKDHGMYNFN